MPRDVRHVLGKVGEDLACCELQRRGYVILARRYRTRCGEIDIVARDGDAVVFIEVKTRTDGSFGGAAMAVTAWKRRRLARMAEDFLARQRLHQSPCRFDVVTIEAEASGVRVQVIPGAFGGVEW